MDQPLIRETHLPTTAHTIHLGITLLHFLTAIGALVMTIVIAVYSLGDKCTPDACQSLIYITSTFLSSRRLQTNMGWPVATVRTPINTPEFPQYPAKEMILQKSPSSNGYVFTHFFECMHSARVADQTCYFPDNFGDYYNCMINNTNTRNALSTCSILATSGTYVNHFMSQEEYITCMNAQPIMKNSVSPRASRNVFRACLAKNQWPFFEIQQDIDSPVLLGSYNWALFLTAGLAIMTSFAVYSASWLEDGPVRYGQPEYFMRLGLFWTFLSWAWNIAFFIIFVLVAFRETNNFEANGGLPTTVSTSLTTVGLFLIAIVYFGNELFVPGEWTFLAHPLKGAGRSTEILHKIVKHYKHHTRPRAAAQASDPASRSLLGAEMALPLPNPTVAEYQVEDHLVARYYTPPLLATWADGYIADVIIFLGMAGATQQLTNDQAWNLAVLIGGYRLLNMMISRFMYECFMNNLSLTNETNTAKFKIKPVFASKESDHDDPHLSTRVMALSTQIAAIYLLIGVCYLTLNNGNVVISDVAIFRNFVILGFVIPESLRILLHLYCQFMNPYGKTSSWLILNVSMFVWTWDLVVRVIFISIVMLQTDKTFQGTREYLIYQGNTLLRDFITLMI